MFNWFRWLYRKNSARRSAGRRLLAVESFESRLTPAVDVSFNGTSLVITDSGSAPFGGDTVAISQGAGGFLEIDLNYNSGTDSFTTTSPAGVVLSGLNNSHAQINTNIFPIATLTVD